LLRFFDLEAQISSSQNDLISFDSNSIRFVRVICDRKASGSNELSCYEDEILAVIEGDLHSSEWLVVKNAFNTIGRIQRRFVESIDGRQADDEQHELLTVPKVQSNPSRHALDTIEELADEEFKKFMTAGELHKNFSFVFTADIVSRNRIDSSSIAH
jgi:hypothetical protein